MVRIHGTWEEATAASGVGREVPASWSNRKAVTAWQTAHLAHHRGELTSREYFDQVSELSCGHYSPADVERIHHAWLVEEYAGMAQLVARLAEAGQHTACLSNTNDYHWRQMSGEPAYPTFRALGTRLASHELRLLKPEPEIYRAALSVLGCQPHEVAFFDDLLENVEAARVAGWNAERIDPKGSPPVQIEAALRGWGVNLQSESEPSR